MPVRKEVSSLTRDAQLAASRAEILKALGNPARLRIMAHLCDEGEATVGAIAAELELAQSTVSQQLAILRLNGLVRARSAGGQRHYSIAIPRVRDLVACLARCDRDRGGRGGDI
jgi:DNA-binding transcriptional ArsR family regulator